MYVITCPSSSFLNVSQETQDRRTGLSLRRQVFPRHSLYRGTLIPLFHQLADPKKNHFVDAYYPTIESTFAKSVTYKGVEYDCHIIDTAGQDEYSPLNSQHAIGIHGYVLVYSITSRNSFNMIQIVYDKIIDFCGVTELPCVIVGSKCDLLQKSVRLPRRGARPNFFQPTSRLHRGPETSRSEQGHLSRVECKGERQRR